MYIPLLFQGGTIRGSARHPHMQAFRLKVTEGLLYIVANFMVSKDELKYKTATHTHKFSIYGKTKVKRIEDLSFPNNRFLFKTFDWIAGLKEEDEAILFGMMFTFFCIYIHNILLFCLILP